MKTAKIINIKSYFGGKVRKFEVEYEDGSTELLDDTYLHYYMNTNKLNVINAHISDKNNKIILDTETEEYKAVDFFNNDLKINDTVLVSIVDTARYTYGKGVRYANMGYGTIIDIVDTNKISVRVSKLEGPSIQWKDDKPDFIVDSKLAVKYNI